MVRGSSGRMTAGVTAGAVMTGIPLPFVVMRGRWRGRLPRSSGLRASSSLISGVFVFILLLSSYVGSSSGAAPMAAADVTSSPTTYAMRHWDTDEGLPSHTITDIKQAPDGYLWMTSTAGLIRFDGTRFTVFDQRNAGLTNPRLSSLRFTPTGGIGVLAEDGTVMESLTTGAPGFSPIAATGGPATSFTEALEAPRVPASMVPGPGWGPRLVDRFGNVWLSSPDAVEVRRPDGGPPFWSHVFPAGTTITAFTEDAEGDVWIGTVTDGLYRIKPVALRVYGEDAGIEDTGVTDVSPRDEGLVFLRSARYLIYVLRNGRATKIGPDTVESTFRDRGGTTWTIRERVIDKIHEVELVEAAAPGG